MRVESLLVVEISAAGKLADDKLDRSKQGKDKKEWGKSVVEAVAVL